MRISKAYTLGFQDGLAGKEKFRGLGPTSPQARDYEQGYKAGQRERAHGE